MSFRYAKMLMKFINVKFYKFYKSELSKSAHWMQTEYDDNVLDYWYLTKRNFIPKLKKMMD